MKVTLFDTETDGLIANEFVDVKFRPRVMEWYSIQIERTGHGQTFDASGLNEIDALLNIGRNVNDLWEMTGRKKKKSATEVTGIKDGDLEGKPDFRSIAEKVREQFESSDLIVAHNIDFDYHVANYEFERFGLAPIKWPKLLCTVEATEHLFGYRLSLSDLHDHLIGKPFSGAHRARIDVLALMKCYIELVRRREVQ